MTSKRAPAGTKIAWAAEDELYTLKASKVAPSAIPPPQADIHSAARAFALRLGADSRTPGVVEEVEAFLNLPVPEGWRKFETADGTCYYGRGEETQWEHPEEEKLFNKLANINSFAGSPLWVWQQRRAMRPANKRSSLVRAWKRRPIISALGPQHALDLGAYRNEQEEENKVEVEILKTGYPKLNWKLVKVFSKYFSVQAEEASRVSFLLKIAAVCPLPRGVRMEMREDTCMFVGEEMSSTRHPCDNFFQVIFDGISPDNLPATPVTKIGNFFFHWEKQALVTSDAHFRRRRLSREFMTVVEMLMNRKSELASQPILEMAFQGICGQNVSLVLTALGDVVSLVHEIAKSENRSSSHVSSADSLNDASWPAVARAVFKTLGNCEEFLRSEGPGFGRPALKSPRRVSLESPKAASKAVAGVVAISMADSDEGDPESDEEEEEEGEELEYECAVTFGGLEKAMNQYPPGAQLFVAELLEQLTTKELAGAVKFLEALVEAGNGELVKAMEERDDLNAELVELSNKINISKFCVVKKMWEVSRPYVPLVMLLEAVVLGYLVFGPRRLSPFVARKITHTVSGLCMLLMGSAHVEGRVFVFVVCAGSLAMTWEFSGLKAFWFGKPRDVGITIYLLIVAFWFALNLPVAVLAPVFFADPAGAIVGKIMTRYARAINPPWIDQKTVFGSIAVLIVTFFTVYKPDDTPSRWTVAVCATLAEAVSGAFDNLLIAGVVVGAWSLVK